MVSDEELPNLTPNLNPPEEEVGADSLSAPPNLKPPDPEPEELSAVPNLKPPELEVEEPKVPPAEEPKEPKALGSTLAPGLAVSQATHLTSAALFCTIQTSHSQAPSGFLNFSVKSNTGALVEDRDAPAEAPGLVLMQATHFVSSALFCTIQVSHSHEPSGGLNLFPKSLSPVEIGSAGADRVLTAEKAEGRVSEGLSPVPGLAVSHATHFTASGLFRTRHVSQSQVPAGLENIVPKPVVADVVEVVVFVLLLLSCITEEAGDCLLSRGLDEELGLVAEQQTHFVSDCLFGTKQTSQVQSVEGLNTPVNPVEEEEDIVEVVEGAADSVEAGWGAVSGLGDVWPTGEAKPGALRRSSTLPCFRVLAGLKGPSKSSVLRFVAGFTAATIGVASFPFDMEGPNFATGALKVNPAEGENEGGLEAVALTMGDEKVKGTQGGVVAFGGSLFVSFSLAGVMAGTRGEELLEEREVVGGKGDEKLKVGKADVLRGSEIMGRSGTSATSSSSRLLLEARAVVLSLFIFPPPEPTLLAVGVLDRG